MHAVGDVANGNLVFALAGKKAGPHIAGDFSVQRRNGVRASRQTQSPTRSYRTIQRIRRVFAAQAHQGFMAKSHRIAKRAEVFFDQAGVEAVVAGRHGRVGREDNLARDARDCLAEVDAFFLHAAADGLQNAEGAVAFIQVQYAGRNSHRRKARSRRRPAGVPDGCGCGIAAIEARSQFAVFGSIAVHIGIQQQQIATADL